MTHEISAGLGKGDRGVGRVREREWMRRPWRGKRESEREGGREGGGGELRYCMYT